jgi:hypothetical protein
LLKLLLKEERKKEETMTDVCYMSDGDDDDDFMVDDDNQDFAPNVLAESTNKSASAANKRSKKVEETYQKLTPHEVS